MSETKFVDGLYVDKPNDNAPDFVKGKLSVKASQFCQFLKKMDTDGELNNGYLNIDILESKAGKWYAKINDYKSGEGSAPAAQSTPSAPSNDFDDDILF